MPNRIEVRRDVPTTTLVEELKLKFDLELARIVLLGPAAFAIEGGRSRLRPDMTMTEFLKLLPGDAPRRFVEFYAPLYAQKNPYVSA